MPPSPIITASVNEPMYARLLAELDDLVRPEIVFKPGTKNYGLWTSPSTMHPYGLIALYMMTAYDTDQLRFVSSELSRTLLHETRHAWQDRHRPEMFNDKLPYRLRPQEIDAFEFEDERLHDYRTLVKVTRKFPSSPFSRLSKTERTVRQSM